MIKYVVSKNTVDAAYVALAELINTLEDNRADLCIEDMALLYGLKQANSELTKLLLTETYEGEVINANN